MRNPARRFAASLVTTLATLALVTPAAHADLYEVTLTNVTGGQTFTPRLYVTHTAGQLFTMGKPALPEVAAVAEAGDIAPLQALIGKLGANITASKVGDGMLMPGKSETIMIDGTPGARLSLVYMLLPTNDGFSGLNAVTLPASGSMTFTAPAWDAGSEANDEKCLNIPGPLCGGAGPSPSDAGEGYIFIHSGIHGGGDASVKNHDWQNPVTMVVVTKK